MKYFLIILGVAILAVLVWVIFFSGSPARPAPPVSEQTSMPPVAQTSAANATSTKADLVTLQTNYGNLTITLDYAAAPQTSANFAKLVSAGFYNGLTFHRIIPGFVIQGGDPKGDGSGGPGYTVPAEIKLPHKRGSVAMARLGDQANPSRASSGSQFYIALQDLPQLDGQYTVFGQVTVGMDVVDKIAAVKTDPSTDKPLQPVIITKALIAQ